MGSDLTVVNAARVSFNKESEWVNGEEGSLKKRDKGLIRYLARNNHWTPFGHCFATFRIKAPLFVARQLVKHTVGLCWNEVSRRYVTYAPTFFDMGEWRGRPANMKQGSAGDPHSMSQEQADAVCDLATRQAYAAYQEMLDRGVAPEQARMVLPQSMMTEWYWSGSLAAWARVCKLRLDPHAQKETGEVARFIDAHMRERFPVSWEAFIKDVAV
jgi:thymidylate synthase (FAD)